MKTGIWIGAFIIVLSFCLSASSREVSMLQGRVVDDRGNPLPKYPVYLETSQGSIVAFTDSQGVFQFFNLLPSRQYTVFVKEGTRLTVSIKQSVEKLPRDLVVGK